MRSSTIALLKTMTTEDLQAARGDVQRITGNNVATERTRADYIQAIDAELKARAIGGRP